MRTQLTLCEEVERLNTIATGLRGSIAIRAFCAYSQIDEKLKRDLFSALSPLERAKLLEVWHFRVIPAGKEWEAEISLHLQSAEIIFLLVSADFISSDYCYSIEMAYALDRHSSGKARVVPILLRDCLWEGLPFSRLQMLPTGSRPVRSWSNRDAAWTDIARGVQSVIEDIESNGIVTIPKDELEEEIPMEVQGRPHNNFFDVAAAGDTSVSAEDEPQFALNSVRQCRTSMRTISYREEDWWTADEGQAYLQEQSDLLARNGTIERVFIIPGDSRQDGLESLKPTMDQQVDVGVDVLFVYESDIPSGYFAWIQDFILYDDQLLRVSTTVPPEGLLGRPAEVHTDPDMVRRGLQWFNGLKALSARWVAPSRG